MGLKDVQDSIVKKQESSLMKAGAEQSVEASAQKHYKMANVLCKHKNYSASYFMYFVSLKEYSILYVSRNMGVELSGDETLDFLAKRNKFGLDEGLLKIFRKKKEQTATSNKIERSECEDIKKHIVEMRKSL